MNYNYSGYDCIILLGVAIKDKYLLSDSLVNRFCIVFNFNGSFISKNSYFYSGSLNPAQSSSSLSDYYFTSSYGAKPAQSPSLSIFSSF